MDAEVTPENRDAEERRGNQTDAQDSAQKGDAGVCSTCNKQYDFLRSERHPVVIKLNIFSFNFKILSSIHILYQSFHEERGVPCVINLNFLSGSAI